MAAASSLFRHSVRSHIGGALWCGIGGGIAMVVTAAGLVREMDSFAGGPAALGALVTATAEAMRVLRWPAERLDTLGGYLTYHNVLLAPLLLGIYAAVQGAHALRGSEEKRVLDLWLATGHPRWRVAVDRAAAFGVALAIVALGIGAGTSVGMGLGGDPQVVASLVVAGVSALSVAAFYALALALSSLFVTSGAATGATVLVMVGLYLATNVWERLGAFGAIRYVSPFWLRQRSDMLIPGRTFDAGATLALAAITVALIAVGTVAFARRDYAGTLVRRTGRATDRRAAGTLAWRPTIAIGSLFEQRLGLAAWAAGTGVFMAVYMGLIPQVEQLWERMGFYRELLAPKAGGDLVTQLVGLSAEFLAPVLAAFAVVQSARWVRERTDGRDELVLAQPVSRTRYLVERLGTLTAGALVVALGAEAGLVIGGVSGDVRIDAAGLARLMADLVLLAVAVGAVALALVALLRGTGAVALLSAWIVAMYLVVLFAPLFEWPDWVERLSVFDAFGEPYVAAPDSYGVVTLVAVAVAGIAVTIGTLERRRAV